MDEELSLDCSTCNSVLVCQSLKRHCANQGILNPNLVPNPTLNSNPHESESTSGSWVRIRIQIWVLVFKLQIKIQLKTCFCTVGKHDQVLSKVQWTYSPTLYLWIDKFIHSKAKSPWISRISAYSG